MSCPTIFKEEFEVVYVLQSSPGLHISTYCIPIRVGLSIFRFPCKFGWSGCLAGLHVCIIRAALQNPTYHAMSGVRPRPNFIFYTTITINVFSSQWNVGGTTGTTTISSVVYLLRELLLLLLITFCGTLTSDTHRNTLILHTTIFIRRTCSFVRCCCFYAYT